jgi:hypothetical protein
MPPTAIEKLLAEIDERVNSGCKVWIFQATPKRYNLLGRLKEIKVGDKDFWEINQHKEEILNGHVALIWLCGDEAGIYALADIISNPEMLVDSEDSTKHWTHDKDKLQKKLRVKIRFSLILKGNYITGEELKRKSLQGTNFAVTESEWLNISKMIRQRFMPER